MLALAQTRPILRARDVAAQGIDTGALTRLTRTDALEKVRRDDTGWLSKANEGAPGREPRHERRKTSIEDQAPCGAERALFAVQLRTFCAVEKPAFVSTPFGVVLGCDDADPPSLS